MSKTFKTTPWWVRMAASPSVFASQEHDHVDGVRDLPPRPTVDWWRTPTRCQWEPSHRLWSEGTGCSCFCCGDTSGRRHRARRRRRLTRQIGRRLRRAGVDPDEVADAMVDTITDPW